MALINLGVDTPNCSQPFLGGPSMPEVCVSNNIALFLPLFSTLVAYNPEIADPCGRVKPVKKTDLSYDFIVVGAGAAGPVVASRLSENPKWKVLLIEAGEDEPGGAEIPSYLQTYLGTSMDWNYTTSDEPYACLANNNSCQWPRGRNMGGCTAHHGMAYHRGNAKDYERWEKMGATGWSWDEVFPYFLKFEDNREIGRVSKKYHGTGGLMTVERFRWQPKFAWDILDAANETNFGVSEDLVGDQITGFTIAQTMSKDGVRQSTAAAYLRPYRDRPNLHVAMNSFVTKLGMKNKTVNKLEYIRNGKLFTVKATKEIIISAGTINSPIILQRSGIGPKDDLKSVHIPVIHDLPGVGKNLHNHQSYGIDFTMDQTMVNCKMEDEQIFNVDTVDQYLYNQTGPLSSTGLAQVTAILNSSYTTKDDPDIQLFFAGFQATCTSKQNIADLQASNNQLAIRMTSVNIHPKSRGVIKLMDNKPESVPYIRSNDLQHFQDRAVIVAGIRVIQAIANSTVMQKRNLKQIKQISEPCSIYEYDSNDYWICEIQWNTRPENHQAGTCKMGSKNDPMAVVDSELKVHGIKGLRVADASIMPQVVSGNPAAAITMIGERCADFIKKDYIK